MKTAARVSGADGAPAEAHRQERATVLATTNRVQKEELLALSAAAAADIQVFVGRRVSSVEDAEDITQQAIAVACAAVNRLRGGNLQYWLLAIARNLIVDHYRAQNRYQFVELTETLAQREPALQTAPTAADDGRQRLAAVLNQIAGVCLERQVAVLLSDVYGHCDKDSAAVLHMSVPSFKLLLHGARARMRERAARGSTPTNPGVRTRRLGVICQLSTEELLAVRDRLLQGLKIR